MGVEIVRAETVTDELVAAFARLIPQLSSSSPPPTADELSAIVATTDTVLFVARLGGRVVGSLTLAFYRIPTGLKAWIEDVVVDERRAWQRDRRGAQPGGDRRGPATPGARTSA